MDAKTLQRQIDSGKSFRAIARDLGISLFKTRYWIGKHGLRTRLASNRALSKIAAKASSSHVEMTCAIHGLTKFYRVHSENRYRCLACNVMFVHRRRKKLKSHAVTYKGGECERCGYKRCLAALEFHHLDPQGKDFIIATGAVLGWRSMKTELDKCILLCANCHREEHEKILAP